MTNAVELTVTLAIWFQTNCNTHFAASDGHIKQQCVVERICSVNHDLGDGYRLQLAVTNEVDRFEKELIVRKRHHPILGAIDVSLPVGTNLVTTAPSAPKVMIYPPTPKTP